jgi:uncharacterized protein
MVARIARSIPSLVLLPSLAWIPRHSCVITSILATKNIYVPFPWLGHASHHIPFDKLRAYDGGVILSVSITPNGSKNELVEWKGEVLKIRIAAPPVDGKANKELLSFLADVLSLSPSSLTIKNGHASKKKLIEIPLDQAIIRNRLSKKLKKPALF